MFFLTMYQSTVPQRGAACMPKRVLDHMQCEVMRFFKVVPSKQIVEPIVFTVPRKVCLTLSHCPTLPSSPTLV